MSNIGSIQSLRGLELLLHANSYLDPIQSLNQKIFNDFGVKIDENEFVKLLNEAQSLLPYLNVNQADIVRTITQNLDVFWFFISSKVRLHDIAILLTPSILEKIQSSRELQFKFILSQPILHFFYDKDANYFLKFFEFINEKYKDLNDTGLDPALRSWLECLRSIDREKTITNDMRSFMQDLVIQNELTGVFDLLFTRSENHGNRDFCELIFMLNACADEAVYESAASTEFKELTPEFNEQLQKIDDFFCKKQKKGVQLGMTLDQIQERFRHFFELYSSNESRSSSCQNKLEKVKKLVNFHLNSFWWAFCNCHSMYSISTKLTYRFIDSVVADRKLYLKLVLARAFMPFFLSLKVKNSEFEYLIEFLRSNYKQYTYNSAVPRCLQQLMPKLLQIDAAAPSKFSEKLLNQITQPSDQDLQECLAFLCDQNQPCLDQNPSIDWLDVKRKNIGADISDQEVESFIRDLFCTIKHQESLGIQIVKKHTANPQHVHNFVSSDYDAHRVTKNHLRYLVANYKVSWMLFACITAVAKMGRFFPIPAIEKMKKNPFFYNKVLISKNFFALLLGRRHEITRYIKIFIHFIDRDYRSIPSSSLSSWHPSIGTLLSYLKAVDDKKKLSLEELNGLPLDKLPDPDNFIKFLGYVYELCGNQTLESDASAASEENYPAIENRNVGKRTSDVLMPSNSLMPTKRIKV